MDLLVNCTWLTHSLTHLEAVGLLAVTWLGIPLVDVVFQCSNPPRGRRRRRLRVGHHRVVAENSAPLAANSIKRREFKHAKWMDVRTVNLDIFVAVVHFFSKNCFRSFSAVLFEFNFVWHADIVSFLCIFRLTRGGNNVKYCLSIRLFHTFGKNLKVLRSTTTFRQQNVRTLSILLSRCQKLFTPSTSPSLFEFLFFVKKTYVVWGDYDRYMLLCM
jgi:hypothetical protein